jgi:hypothetical protein
MGQTIAKPTGIDWGRREQTLQGLAGCATTLPLRHGTVPASQGGKPMPQASDYFDDVSKYAGECNEAAVAGIVKYLGIALYKKDSSLVSGTDPKELERVKNNFLIKKLGLGEADGLDAAIADVMAAMKGDNSKQRVTVYYMLAKKYGKLGLFGG